MSNPLALLPLAVAAGGGRVNEFEAQQLVAAGLTLLQRSAPLVRSLGGRRSAIFLPTSPAFFTALAASEGRGAVLINPLAAPLEIAAQCEEAGVGAVFTTTRLAARLPAGPVVVLLDEAPRSARVLANGFSRDVDLGSHHGLALEGERDAAGRDEEAAIVYTSAMRGTPLGAVLTHANLLANARATVQTLANTTDDHVLALLPFAHLFGFTVTGAAPLLAGARVTTMPRFHPARALELIASGVTEVVGVPSVFRALLDALARLRIDLRGSALRLCVCGGAELTGELQDHWARATGVELRQGYGLTEAAPVCLFNDVGRANVRGSLGRAYPGVDVRIYPPADYRVADVPRAPRSAAEPLPDGVSGEICVRGENVFRGYLHDRREGLPRHDAWLHTGDRGVRDADGSVRFLGLLKPMFTRNGFNIYPRELERAVLELPGVASAQVVSRPDPIREHDIVLRVSGSVTEDDVRRWCEQRLSAYKRPTVVEIVPG